MLSRAGGKNASMIERVP
ncbi:hypothetical protein HaLaN_06494 [Haematococcus lacustris]|uniref:Uncharacterized protein n=1 Tax=Haematococcus lacustris TaxID=44745 RepID=A0A699YND2_HAELA|nr:hypothetical protein HaLaN_06494 [Haematococcus lacustris]